MKIFYIDTPIDDRKDMEYKAWYLQGLDNEVLPELPEECATFFREEHCDVWHSLFLNNYPAYEEMLDEGYAAKTLGFIFAKPMMDSVGRNGIEFVAIGISTAAPERFYKAMEDTIMSDLCHKPYWNMCKQAIDGYSFIGIRENDVNYVNEILPSLTFDTRYISPYEGWNKSSNWYVCHYFNKDTIF